MSSAALLRPNLTNVADSSRFSLTSDQLNDLSRQDVPGSTEATESEVPVVYFQHV